MNGNVSIPFMTYRDRKCVKNGT